MPGGGDAVGAHFLFGAFQTRLEPCLASPGQLVATRVVLGAFITIYFKKTFHPLRITVKLKADRRREKDLKAVYFGV